MTPAPTDPLDACRAAVAAADHERDPTTAALAAAILLGALLAGGATLAWLRLRVVPAVAAPVTLTTALAPAKLVTKAAPAPVPAPAPAARGGDAGR